MTDGKNEKGMVFPPSAPPDEQPPPYMAQPQPLGQQPHGYYVPQPQANAQPQQVVVVVSQQPQAWSSGVLSCCKDTSSCCWGTFCVCCNAISVSKRLDEGCCGCLWCCVVANRSKMRSRYHLQGSYTEDCCWSYWCCGCTLCQMDRELAHQGKSR